jgi:hypothetical protein
MHIGWKYTEIFIHVKGNATNNNARFLEYMFSKCIFLLFCILHGPTEKAVSVVELLNYIQEDDWFKS